MSIQKLLAKLRCGKAETRRMAQPMDQYTAGGLALRIIVRWMIDGGEAQRMRELIRWLIMSDLVLTEDLLILVALKSLDASGEELSIDSLRAKLSPQDPAGFARIVLDQIVESRHGYPADGPELDQFLQILAELRKGREEELKTAKRTAVSIARQVLAREMGVIEGAGDLQWVEDHFRADESHVFTIFSRIARETQSHPVPAQRRLWAEDALARIDRERAELEEKVWPEVELACKKVIERWATV